MTIIKLNNLFLLIMITIQIFNLSIFIQEHSINILQPWIKIKLAIKQWLILNSKTHKKNFKKNNNKLSEIKYNNRINNNQLLIKLQLEIKIIVKIQKIQSILKINLNQ